MWRQEHKGQHSSLASGRLWPDLCTTVPPALALLQLFTATHEQALLESFSRVMTLAVRLDPQLVMQPEGEV